MAAGLGLAVDPSTVAGFGLAMVVDLGQDAVLVMVERSDQVVALAVVVDMGQDAVLVMVERLDQVVALAVVVGWV